VNILKETSGIHVGFLYFDSLFWSMVNHGLQTEAERVGVKFSSIPTRTSDEQMISLKQLLAQGVNALLIESVSANVSEFIPVLDEIRARNIPLVFLNAEIEDHPEFCTVRSDHRKGQILVAEYLFEQLGGRGKVAYLQGIGRPGEIRLEGFHSLLKQYPDIEVVLEAQGKWLHEMGRELTRQALNEHADLQGVVAANDAMALGAIEAIAEAGRVGEILVTGFDAIPEALIAIYRKQMIITARQSVRNMASKAMKMVLKAVKGEALPSLVVTEVDLITIENVAEGMMERLKILPGMLRSLAESNQAQQRLQQEIIEAQKQAIQELSTPIIPVFEGVIVMPLIGSIDTLRARDITRSLLKGIREHQAWAVILDITGVPIVDSGVAACLNRTVQAARLKGARAIVTGISEAVAETIADLGIDWSGIETLSDLQRGLIAALGSLGLRIGRDTK
jgi:ABC-type sugar transport system substrate-binding protein/anti-anti-sigma regulatory factor